MASEFAVRLTDSGVPKKPCVPGTLAGAAELSGVCSG